MNYKICTRCNKNKSTQEFYVRSSKMWYGHLVCKQCCKEKRAIDKKVATGLFDDMSKVCTECFRDKWLDDFEYHPTGLHDRRSVCKSCRKDYANSSGNKGKCRECCQTFCSWRNVRSDGSRNQQSIGRCKCFPNHQGLLWPLPYRLPA